MGFALGTITNSADFSFGVHGTNKHFIPDEGMVL